MVMERSVYASTHVYAPFEQVQAVLRDNPMRVLGEPGDTSTHDLHSREIEIHAGPVAIHDRFTIDLASFDCFPEHHYCRIQLRFHGDRHHVLVPDVRGVIEASDAGDGRTQLELIGHYQPRMGAVGALEDALVGHRAVEEAMTRVLEDLRSRLQATPRTASATGTAPPGTRHDERGPRTVGQR
jgi:hypothetical protein